MESTLDAVREIVGEVAAVSPSEITGATRFGIDIDTDSLDLYDAVNLLEMRFSVCIEDQDLYDIKSVADLVELVDRLPRSA